MNDWEIRELLSVIFAIQITLWGLIGLDYINFHIPLLRELIGFIYLTFVPGILLLRLLKIHNLDITKNVLFTIGLSVTVVMIVGLFMNTFYPLFGISGPISVLPLMITISIIVLILCILSLKVDGGLQHPNNIETRKVLTPSILFLSLIPFLAIFGTYLMNHRENNFLILFLLVLVSSIPIFIAFNKFPKEVHPLAIYIASISILLHTNLISGHIWGWDSHYEYYVANLVQENSYWVSDTMNSVNGLLIFSILAPVYSEITSINLAWVFKIFFPIIFSFVPLGIYHICSDQFENKLVSTLSPFLFMFYYGFFKSMPGKQHISEFFFILLILLILDKKIPDFFKRMLAIIFSFSLVVTHYGVSHLFMLFLLFSIVFVFFFREGGKQNDIVRPSFGLLYSIITIGWFMYVAGGVTFNNVVSIGGHIYTNLFEILQSPPGRSGIGYATSEMPTMAWEIYKYLHYAFQVFIILGIAKLLLSIIRKKRLVQDVEFAAFSLASFSFLITSALITFSMGMDRAIQITLLLLTPFATIGFINLFQVLSIIFGYSIHRKTSSKVKTRVDLPIKIFSVFLAFFLLFNSGVIFEISKDPFPALFNLNNSTEFPVYSTEEITGALWLENYAQNTHISSDDRDELLLSEFFPRDDISTFDPNTTILRSQSYLYLGHFAAEEEKILGKNLFGFNKEHIRINDTVFYNSVLRKENKVYNNGGCEIYYD